MQAGRHGTGAVIESLHLIVKVEGETSKPMPVPHLLKHPPTGNQTFKPMSLEAILIQTTRPSFQILGIQACATILGFIIKILQH